VSVNQRWQMAGIFVGLGLLLWLLGPVLTPFAFAALLAYLGDPLVDRLQKRGASRSLSVSIVFGIMTLAMLLVPLILVPLIEDQITALIERLPIYIDWVRKQLMPLLVERFGVDPEMFSTDQIIAMFKEHWRQAGGIAATLIAWGSKSGLALIGWIMTALLIPVITFYFLRDWDNMLVRVRELLPRHMEPRVVQLARESDDVLSAFIRGQVSVMLVLGLIYSLGLWLAGLKLAFLIGMAAGLLSFVPYLGGALGIGAAVIAALAEYRDVAHVVYVLAVFGIGHSLESFVLTPWLVGDRIGLHPVAVIFAILAGGQLFGFVGVLLALPVAAVLMVILRHVHERYVGSGLYRDGAVAETAPIVDPETVTADGGSIAATGVDAMVVVVAATTSEMLVTVVDTDAFESPHVREAIMEASAHSADLQRAAEQAAPAHNPDPPEASAHSADPQQEASTHGADPPPAS
jgi:predicted PurR-regulated permease PerM